MSCTCRENGPLLECLGLEVFLISLDVDTWRQGPPNSGPQVCAASSSNHCTTPSASASQALGLQEYIAMPSILGRGDQTQGLMQSRQARYQLSCAPFVSSFFLYCPQQTQDAAGQNRGKDLQALCRAFPRVSFNPHSSL